MCRVINLPDKINVVPFCNDVSGRETELTCFENTRRYPVTLEVQGTILKYGIEPEGCLFAVMCDNRFVIALDRIVCWYRAFFRNGRDAYQFNNADRSLYVKAGDDRRFAYWWNIDDRHENGTGMLYEDGAILLNGYRIPKSPQECPFVFTRVDFDYIDSSGDTAAIATEREIIVYDGIVESPCKTIKIKNGWQVTELGVSYRWLIYNTIKHGASVVYFDEDLRNGWQYFHRTKYPEEFSNTFH